MDWLPQIIVKAEDDQSIPTSVAALKTFSTGFPDTKATVHCIGVKSLPVCKEWTQEGGHKLIKYPSTVKTSQLHYEIVKKTRLPVVLIAGTTVFFGDVSEYSTTKLFGADTIPAWNPTDKTVNIQSIEKTIIFVAKPLEVIEKLEEITSDFGSAVDKWGKQSVIMCGKMYNQTSGIFNMLYNFDSSLFTNFSSKTANKYETVFGGNAVSSTMKKLEATGHDTNSFMPYINAAMNEDWESVKGYRKVFIDSIS